MSEPPSRPPDRHPYAGGDYLTRYPEGSRYQLRIDCPFEKPGWQAHKPAAPNQLPFAGTPVLFEGDYWEVARHEIVPGSGRVCYYLNPWDEVFPMRPPVEYTREACEAALRAWHDHRKDTRKSVMLRLLGPLISLLPAHDQKRMELEYDLPAARNTVISSCLLWSFSMTGIVVGMASGFAGGHVPDGLAWMARWRLLFLLLFLDSALRFFSGFKLGEPMGSLFVVLPIETVRAFARALAPGSKPTPAQRDTPRAKPPLRDEVRPATRPEFDLEIVSPMAKPHWTLHHTAIRHEDIWYQVVDCQILEPEPSEPGKPRHLFSLRHLEEGTPIRYPLEYSPDEPQRLHRSEVLEAKSTWVETFALLWGFLDPPRQRLLQKAYDFDAHRYTLHSVVLAGGLGLLAVIIAMSHIARNTAGLGDILALVIGGFFVWESVLRWRSWSAGTLSGSVLGHLLAPLVAPLLQNVE